MSVVDIDDVVGFSVNKATDAAAAAIAVNDRIAGGHPMWGAKRYGVGKGVVHGHGRGQNYYRTTGRSQMQALQVVARRRQLLSYARGRVIQAGGKFEIVGIDLDDVVMRRSSIGHKTADTRAAPVAVIDLVTGIEAMPH